MVPGEVDACCDDRERASPPELSMHHEPTFLHVARMGVGALLLLGGCTEVGDNFNSEVECRSFCSKRFDCDEENPTNAQTNECVRDCRDAIEDDCGNDNQADANAQIGECVDMACGDFWTCMVFEAAPECFGFVSN